MLTDYPGRLKTDVCFHYSVWRSWLDLICLMVPVSMPKEFPVLSRWPCQLHVLGLRAGWEGVGPSGWGPFLYFSELGTRVPWSKWYRDNASVPQVYPAAVA